MESGIKLKFGIRRGLREVGREEAVIRGGEEVDKPLTLRQLHE